MKTALFTIGGVAYGFILLVLGFLAAGFGHGVFIPISMFSSPIWEILHAVIPEGPEYQTFALIVFALGIVSLWGCVGWLLAALARRSARITLVVLLAVHYVALPFVFLNGDWSYFPRVWKVEPLILVAGFSLYLLGQVAVWLILIRSFLGRKTY